MPGEQILTIAGNRLQVN